MRDCAVRESIFETSDRLCSERCLRDYMRKRLQEVKAGTLQRLRAPDDYRSGSQFLRIRAEADKARYARELPLSERAREVLDEVCPDEGILFPKFAWRYPLRTAALAAGLEPDRASQVKPCDFRHSVATELTERSGNLLGVGYLLGHRHATTTNQYVHARRRAVESVLSGHNSGHVESSFEVPVIGDRANPATSLQCEGQDSNLHALRTLEPKSSASANSATLAYGLVTDG